MLGNYKAFDQPQVLSNNMEITFNRKVRYRKKPMKSPNGRIFHGFLYPTFLLLNVISRLLLNACGVIKALLLPIQDKILLPR